MPVVAPVDPPLIEPVIEAVIEAAELRCDVRAGTALPTTKLDRRLERVQGGDDHLPIRIPPAALAFVEPLARRSVATFTVAPSARRQLVLDPARTALDARHEMLGRGRHQPDLEWSPAPHARRTVTCEDDRHPLAPAELCAGRGGDRPSQSVVVLVVGFHRRQNDRVPEPVVSRTSGRFAPSPTGRLHLGNLRTALVAWLAARADGLQFVVRMEDLDRVTASPEHERRQLDDLAAIGLDWDGVVIRQSERFDRYRSAIAQLRTAGRVYECYCTRREIQVEIESAVRAPHSHLPDGAYPGTCRELDGEQRQSRAASGRRPALRLRTDGESLDVDDRLAGRYTGAVDDVVLARADGVPAYNLAVVVDDAAQHVSQVVRGDDLLSSTPRQLLLQRLLGFDHPEYLHLPLVLGGDGQRLAKRHGAVTLDDLVAVGWAPSEVLAVLARSLGLASPGERVTAAHLVDRFDPASLPNRPVGHAELIAMR
jgi:glutamyl-tRNA synthetase